MAKSKHLPVIYFNNVLNICLFIIELECSTFENYKNKTICCSGFQFFN